MASTSAGALLNRLRHILVPHTGAAATDAWLLARFRADRAEDAFEALVRRHGPMVLGVCRRVLGHRQDAEDAFQAAFLVLARKAASIRARGLLANWLYGVTLYTALKAKPGALRHANRERQVTAMPEPAAVQHEADTDWQPILD